MDFDEEARLAHKERVLQEYNEREYKELFGENIYTNYCLWCNAFADNRAKISARKFGEYVKENKIELTDRQRVHIAEKYFGIKMQYNYETEKWEIVK